MLSSSSRAFSPPLSTVSSAQGSPSPVHVKKVVVEGRSKHDGASLRMYLKLSVAVDNVLPGASIPLFPEDNIRITQSKVHPLDERSVPYSYSATEQPLLHKTALALQLGPKSSRAYHTLFPLTSPPMNPAPGGASRRSRESTSSTSTTPPSDERYTGYILVSGYSVTLVLPKEFPPKLQAVAAGTESEGDDGFVKDVPSSWSKRSARRSSSMFQKTSLHMMAGLEVFVPFVTTPPKGPFLVSVPVPRCLDNHLKLRISTPPNNTVPIAIPRGSFASTSSEDDTPGWDFLTDPPVSRKVEKHARKHTYQQSADDEHSDSPSGRSVPGTELIQGAYQSTDVLHVRWAPPLGRRSGVAKTGDGMRRIGVERTVGKMRCEVIGRVRQGVKLQIAYDGICSGLWHPGVATMLGMDIALDVKGRRVSWPEDGTAGWTVSGGNGFGGLYSDAPPPSTASHKLSLESTGSIPFLPTLASRPTITPARGAASLLRAPLPNQHTPDYSFENSPGITPPSATLPSGISSGYFPPMTPDHETRLSRADVSPGKSVTIKVNLLKLLPSAKNELSFTVNGSVIIDVETEDFLPLPTFRVLGSDKEKVDTVVCSRTDDGIVQVGTEPADGPRRSLRMGEDVRCEEGLGLIIQSARTSSSPSSPNLSMPAKNRTPSHVHSRLHAPRVKFEESSNADAASSSASTSLPCVLTTVTPLPTSVHYTHCVRVNIPAYALDADTVEFGLALPQETVSTSAPCAVEVLYASYAGRYVQAEVLPRRTTTLAPTLASFDSPAESQVVGEMQFWVIVHLEDVEADVGAVEVVYLAGDGKNARQSDAKGKAKEEVSVDVLLPCFQLPVSRYEVAVDCPSNFDSHVKYSTLPHHHTTSSNVPKLVHFWLPTGFFPVLSLSLLPSAPTSFSIGGKRSRTRRTAGAIFRTLPHLVAFTLLYLVVSIGSEVRQVHDLLDAAARALVNSIPYPDAGWDDSARPRWAPNPFEVTVTTAASKVTTKTAWEKETISPVTSDTPTIDLAEATRVEETRPPRPTQTRGSHARAALIPLPAVPFLSWKFQLSHEVKETIVKGLMKAWYLVRKVWNYPLDPD